MPKINITFTLRLAQYANMRAVAKNSIYSSDHIKNTSNLTQVFRDFSLLQVFYCSNTRARFPHAFLTVDKSDKCDKAI